MKKYSIAKIVLNVVLIVLIIGGLILTSFFQLKGLDIQIASKRFWADKSILAVLTFLIMLCVSNITEESLKKKDEEYIEKFDYLSKNFSTTCEKGRTNQLKQFILLKNKKKKYETFIRKNKILLEFIRKDEKRLPYYEKLVQTPEQVWENPKACKYTKITYSQMISGVTEVPKKDDENDLSIHRGVLALKKAAFKVLMIIAAGGFVGDLIYQFKAFNNSMIIPLIFKILSALIAIYAGISFGYTLNDRTKVAMKKKLAIYSEFNSFFNDDGTLKKELAVPIAQDEDIPNLQAEIERIKGEIKETEERTEKVHNEFVEQHQTILEQFEKPQSYDL